MCSSVLAQLLLWLGGGDDFHSIKICLILSGLNSNPNNTRDGSKANNHSLHRAPK